MAMRGNRQDGCSASGAFGGDVLDETTSAASRELAPGGVLGRAGGVTEPPSTTPSHNNRPDVAPAESGTTVLDVTAAAASGEVAPGGRLGRAETVTAHQVPTTPPRRRSCRAQQCILDETTSAASWEVAPGGRLGRAETLTAHQVRRMETTVVATSTYPTHFPRT